MTNLDKIISALTTPEKCDDCLSDDAKVKPRQTVNQECRLLASRGELIRQKKVCPVCGGHKLVNRLVKT